MTPSAKEKAAFAALLHDLKRQGERHRRKQLLNKNTDRLQLAADRIEAHYRLTP